MRQEPRDARIGERIDAERPDLELGFRDRVDRGLPTRTIIKQCVMLQVKCVSEK